MRLRPIATLARDASVSYVTMWKAARLLKIDGQLESKPGKGIIATRWGAVKQPGSQMHTSINPGSYKWQRLEQTLSFDLSTDLYPPGVRLPVTKILADSYGVCVRTMTKAILSLCKSGRLNQEPRGYRVPFARSVRTGSSIILIAAEDGNGNISMENARTGDYLRFLEQECAKRRVRLQIALFNDQTGRLELPFQLRRLFEDQGVQSQVIGAIIWQSGIDRHNWIDLAYRFGSLQKPFALLDENGTRTLPGVLFRSHRAKLFTLGFSIKAGEMMGRFLIEKGHKEVLYVSPVHGSLWSQNRLAGLRAAFESAGFNKAVTAATDPNYLLPFQFRDKVSGSLQSGLDRLRCPEASYLPAFLLTVKTLKEKSPAILERGAYAAHVHDMLSVSLDKGRHTAIVAADDDTAVSCLDYLINRKIKVPDEISVAGFDDTLDASVRGITSYNFNGGTAMHMMVSFILDPKRGHSDNPCVELPGNIIERWTVK